MVVDGGRDLSEERYMCSAWRTATSSETRI